MLIQSADDWLQLEIIDRYSNHEVLVRHPTS
jgi:hypothetical protein